MSEVERIRESYQRRSSFPRHDYSFFDPAYLFSMQERERHFLNILKKHQMLPLQEKVILDVGCGDGFWLRELLKYGADSDCLFGVELLPDRVAGARRMSPHITINQGNAEHLDYESESFDIVLQSTVFSSILDNAMKRNIACEMLRLLKTDGAIIWYDFSYNNPSNPDVKGIKKKEIISLFNDCTFEFERTTLAPPVTRTFAKHSIPICYLLEKIPLLLTHFYVVIKKQGEPCPKGRNRVRISASEEHMGNIS